MKNIIIVSLISFLIQFNSRAQCDSIFVTDIEVPEADSLNISVYVNNLTATHHIYLNLILTDNLTGLVIAESSGGHLQLYPNQITTYEIDTTIIFGGWDLYYDLDHIPEPHNITVGFDGVCDSIAWENSLQIDETVISNYPAIYPNPSTDFLYIDSENEISYTVFNTSGNTVIESTTLNGQINIQNLSNGIYFLKIDNATVLQKFIKK